MKTHQITASGKSMRYTLIVSAPVPGPEVCKFLIGFFTHGLWEHLIILAAIDQERSLALLDVDLLGNTQQVNEDVCKWRTSKSSALKRDGWAMTAARMRFSNARSNVRRAIWNRNRLSTAHWQRNLR
jgi:hypothetical protein